MCLDRTKIDLGFTLIVNFFNEETVVEKICMYFSLKITIIGDYRKYQI